MSEFRLTKEFMNDLLFYLPVLQRELEEMKPKYTAAYKEVVVAGGGKPGSKVEGLALKRAALASVLEATEEGLRALHPELRAIYRMHYREGRTYDEIMKRQHWSRRTIARRLALIRAVLRPYLQRVPGSYLALAWREIGTITGRK